MLKEQKRCSELDVPDEWYAKIPGWEKIKPGCRVNILWTGAGLEGVEDDVYLFQLPFCDDQYDMLDFFAHIPNPDNSSGIGDAPQEFVHLIALLENKLVKTIKLIPDETIW